MRLILILSAAAGLAGCASMKAEGRKVTYVCDRGPGLTVVYSEGLARIEAADGASITLQQRPSASGTWYESPTHSLRGKGDEVTYTIGRMVPMQCKAG
ncbi:MAG: MliC family protein [Pseudomonadota bacterium]